MKPPLPLACLLPGAPTLAEIVDWYHQVQGADGGGPYSPEVIQEMGRHLEIPESLLGLILETPSEEVEAIAR